MARCREAMRELQHYLDGALDEHTATRIGRHLDGCRRCGLEARVYTEIKDGLSRSDGAVPADALARLQAFAARLPERDLHA